MNSRQVKVKGCDTVRHSIGSRPDDQADGRLTSPYARLLRAPTLSLVVDVYDRPDIRSVAILGYN